MKKILGLVACVLASVALVGCGKPKIPADTVAAAYIDVNQLVGNVYEAMDELVDEIPNKEQKKEAREVLKELNKTWKENYRCFDFDWAVLTAAKDGSFALVIKCDYEGKDKGFEVLKERLGEFDPVREICRELRLRESAGVKGKYAIFASTEKRLEAMVSLYRDGKGETSDSFDELTDLGSDTIIRIQTAEVEELAEMFGVKDRIKEFGKNCDDKDLTDNILDIGNITFDLNVSDDVLGFELSVDAGSREFAKLVESAFNLAAFTCRVSCDLTMDNVLAELNDLELRKPFLWGLEKCIKEAMSEVAEQVREGLSVDRSGSTATLKLELDTEDVAEVVVPTMFK